MPWGKDAKILLMGKRCKDEVSLRYFITNQPRLLRIASQVFFKNHFQTAMVQGWSGQRALKYWQDIVIIC